MVLVFGSPIAVSAASGMVLVFGSPMPLDPVFQEL